MKNVREKQGSTLGSSNYYIKGAIFIGLGGTGSEVLKRMQKMIENDNTSLASDSEKPFRFLLLDTDERTLIEAPEGINVIFLGGFSPEEFVENQYHEVSNWFSREESKWLRLLYRVKDGAGMIRVMGRLAFYLHRNEFKTMIEGYIVNLTNFLYTLKKRSIAGTTISIDTFIVGSLAGGTGSSMFNDVAAIVQDALKSRYVFQPQITGIFLTGDVYQNVINEEFLKERVQANTFASLTEYFYDKVAPLAHFEERMINASGRKIPISSNNFTNFIIIQDVNKQGVFASLDDLCELAASSLYAMSSIYGRSISIKTNIDSINLTSNLARNALNAPDILSSIGACSIYYPKETIKEYATNVILSKLILKYFYNNTHESEERDADEAVEKLLFKVGLNDMRYGSLSVGPDNIAEYATIALLDEVRKSNNFSNTFLVFDDAFDRILNNPHLTTAESKLDAIIKKGNTIVDKYSEKLAMLFARVADKPDNAKPNIAEKKTELIQAEIQKLYKSKDFGYLDTFLAKLKEKLNDTENVLINKSSMINAQIDKENSGPAAVRFSLSKFNNRLFSNKRKLNFLKTIGKDLLEKYYRAKIESVSYRYARELIAIIESRVSRELNTLKTFESLMQQIHKDIVKPKIDRFTEHFKEIALPNAFMRPSLSAKEIQLLVDKELNSFFKNGAVEPVSYNSIANTLYENFKKKSYAGKEKYCVLRKWIMDNFLKSVMAHYSQFFTNILSLSIYGALRELYDEKTTTKLLEERVAKFKDVSTFVQVDPLKVNSKHISIRNFLFLPPDRDDNNKIDAYWKEITADALGTIMGNGKVSYLPSPNRQVLTFIRLENGIGPSSLVAWEDYIASYKRIVSEEKNSLERDKHIIPVLADKQVEKAIEKVVKFMEQGVS